MDPYAYVIRDRELAPVVVTLPEAQGQGQGQQGLVFRTALGAGQDVFTERALVEDAVLETPDAEHHTRHNDRYAWSLVEAQLKRGPDAWATLFAAHYATGMGTLQWETGDVRALGVLSEAYRVASRTVCHLYAIMATNNVTSYIFRALDAPSNRCIELPLRHGFFPLLSRANHACDPSATLIITGGYSLVGETHGRPVIVRTLRAVQAGEAVTFDYAHAVPAHQKRQALLDLFGFRCTCPRCASLCSVLTCYAKGSLACALCKRRATVG